MTVASFKGNLTKENIVSNWPTLMRKCAYQCFLFVGSIWCIPNNCWGPNTRRSNSCTFPSKIPSLPSGPMVYLESWPDGAGGTSPCGGIDTWDCLYILSLRDLSHPKNLAETLLLLWVCCCNNHPPSHLYYIKSWSNINIWAYYL